MPNSAMSKNYKLFFDEVILRQLQQVSKNQHIKDILRNMLDKIEEDGSRAGKLLDSKIHLYEVKNKHPPLRLYFKPRVYTNEIYVFEFEMKTNEKKQQKTIDQLKHKILKS